MLKLGRYNVSAVLQKTLQWSRERDFAGYSKHDALNSHFLNACSLNNAFLRLAITQAVMRSPFNIRPLLGVPEARNPKGIGLFAHALLDMAETSSDVGLKRRYIEEAGDLLGWLAFHASPVAPVSLATRKLFAGETGCHQGKPDPGGLIGAGWGYHYPWQDKGFFQPRHYPNRVVTCWIGFAYLRAYEVTREARYLEMCREIASFLTGNPRVLFEDAGQLCLSYVPFTDINWAVMDVSALVSAYLARYAALLDNTSSEADKLRATARRLMAFVVNRQTDYGAWFYTWPAGDSHIKHDNYHTGIILDCLADYMTYTRDRCWEKPYLHGLGYYRKALFSSQGAPRWMNDREYPHDIHGAASGILAFTRAAAFDSANCSSHLEMADRILDWTLRTLYDQRGFFSYQETRFYRKRFCLMRWGNAWMCQAIAQRLLLG